MVTRVRQWALGLALIVFTGLATAVPASAGSLSPRQYYDGTIAWTAHLECITQQVEYITGSFVGYYGTSDVTWPRVGDLYYVRLVFSVVGNECAGGIAPLVEMLLPPNTQFAISGTDPVYCYYTSPSNVTSQVTSGCPQTYGVGAYGARFNWPYPLPYGSSLDIRFPVVSSQPLSGIAGNHYVQAAMSPILGAWAFPYQGVFVAPDDRIFVDGFNANSLGAWGVTQTDGGDLYTQSWAAMRGSGYGLVANVDDTTSLFVQDNHPSNQSRYRARFYLHPYTFNPGESLNHFRTRVFLAFDEVPTQKRVMAIVLKRQGGVYSLAVRVRRDDNVQVDTSFFPLSVAAHSIEIDWQRATGPGANNGALRVWIDDVLKQTLSGIDNDQLGIDSVRMGALSLKGGAGGQLLFDELESRSLTAVGP
jgi:hypothetical protein